MENIIICLMRNNKKEGAINEENKSNYIYNNNFNNEYIKCICH